MSRQEPTPGATATVEWVVGADDLASRTTLGVDESYPPVFATARMITLMELAGGRVLAPLLLPGELSVGVRVDVSHTAPTPEGAKVRATARFVGVESGLYRFEVEAYDGGGEIGRGVHHRAIVEVARLLARAAKRR
jgi:fluoroacetyl-CoA thioesterase